MERDRERGIEGEREIWREGERERGMWRDRGIEGGGERGIGSEREGEIVREGERERLREAGRIRFVQHRSYNGTAARNQRANEDLKPFELEFTAGGPQLRCDRTCDGTEVYNVQRRGISSEYISLPFSLHFTFSPSPFLPLSLFSTLSLYVSLAISPSPTISTYVTSLSLSLSLYLSRSPPLCISLSLSLDLHFFHLFQFVINAWSQLTTCLITTLKPSMELDRSMLTVLELLALCRAILFVLHVLRT